MDKIQPYINEYKVSLIGGVAVGLGYLGKKLLKRELLPHTSARKIAESFAFVALSGVAAQKIQKSMKKKSPSMELVRNFKDIKNFSIHLLKETM